MLMEEALRRENVTAAYARVVSNKGAPGVDGVRMLGIPTTLDRLIQQALLQVLHPIFDPTFSDGSFGFRPGRSAHGAIVRAREHMAAGHRMRRYLQAGMMEGGVVSARTEGTPQGGPLSPLLSNVLLDELDRELERREHRFVRYADDSNVYVRSRAAGERVMASLERFLGKRLWLRVNRDKSAVARPWKRKFLGYSVTVNREPRLRVAPESVQRLKAKLRPILRRGRGRNLAGVAEELSPVLRGWVACYRMVEVKVSFEELDAWIRRKMRCIVWRQWTRPRTRFKELQRRGLDEARAATSAYNGHGPWWNAGASHINYALPVRTLRKLGLVSLLEEHRRLACSS